MQYHDILRNYIRDYAIPGMLEQGWAYKAAKSYGWEQAQRGPEYHVDQSLRTHIINGLFALTRILEYLKKQAYYEIGDNDFKKALVLYTLHDAYKDSEIAATRMDSGNFSVPLSPLDELVEKMHLRKFVQVSAEDIRVASVSLQSSRVADLSSCPPGTSHLLTLVHLADALASQQTAQDFTTAENRLRELTGHTSFIARQEERMSKRLGKQIPTSVTRPNLKFYYHELDEYRGLSTLLIHKTTEEILAGFNLYPILYFANGTLYIGPEGIEPDINDIYNKIAVALFAIIKQETQNESPSIASDACTMGKGLKIEKYAYLFCSLDTLFEAITDKASVNKAVGFVRKAIEKRVNTKKYEKIADFYSQYSIPLNADNKESQAQSWQAVYRIITATENIATDLVPGSSLEWLFSTFNTPAQIASTIRENFKTLNSGGALDYCYIIAYHWLIQEHFSPGDRTWLEVPDTVVKERTVQVAYHALHPYEKEDRILAFVEKELGIQTDTIAYLRSNLRFSFNANRFEDVDPLNEYEKERKRTHKRLCVICSRVINSLVSKKSSEIKTTIAEQNALVFSNKIQPSMRLKSEFMVWCPMCYLEFMLRKLSGQSYPANSDYNTSCRLYLYVLPDYSFTPQLWEKTSEDLLKHFYPKETTVSRLALRGGKENPGIPARWLEQRTIDSAWLEQVQNMFAEQAARIKTPTKDGKPRSKFGDRLTFSFKSPNYMLITYDNIVSKSADKNLIPTRVEVWTKALYAAALIHLLTGARVYITDKPYLSIMRPEQMKTIIEMEGLHPLLYSLLPLKSTSAPDDTVQRASESNARLPLAALLTSLDLLAAIWEINGALFPAKPDERRNLDKQVASVLEEVRSNYLAGATLYKKRERDKAKPYALFALACKLLLPQPLDHLDANRQLLYSEGYSLMIDKQEGVTLMNLAKRITNMSLELYLPLTGKEGRAHRYENIFRTGIEVIKSNANTGSDDEELVAKVAGNILKRLDRISGGKCPTPPGQKRTETVKALAELLVKELYIKQCGRSISKLTHQENALADAVFFFTSQQISSRWDADKKRTQAKKAE